MKIFSKSFCLIVLLSMSLVFCPLVRAEDEVEDENVEEDVVVNEDSASEESLEATPETETEEESIETLSSPFVKTNVLFVQPENYDLPAGKLVKLLVGFQNNGTVPFLVESIEGSFRYPQDFSYHIQNFSLFEFGKIIESDKEATFNYYFTPSETFSQRQFGLTINLRYRNAEGKTYMNTVFNSTVNVVEPDEGLDGETFFLYVFLAAIVVLMLFGAFQFLSVFKKKSRSSKSSNVNTTSTDGIDYEWIPKEHLQTSKSPKVSPRQRKTNRRNVQGNSSNDEQ